jgi:multidrug resistance efflux pump
VILINDPTLFAAKPGRLVEGPNEGDRVQAGQVIARIDDTEALLSYQAATYEKEVAQKKAENDVDIRYAEAQEKVTEAEYDEAVEANERARGAMSQSEIRRRKFQHKRSGLATEQARRDHILAQIEVKVADAKLQAAKHDWETRRLTSEINGVVSERFMQVGEWANAGDPVAKLMQLDKIRVLGYVEANRIARNDVIGKPVMIDVRLTGSRVERIQAKIDHAGFEVDGAGTYKVWADIDNIGEGGDFAIHPGCTAKMVIDISGRLGLNAGNSQFISAPGSEESTR